MTKLLTLMGLALLIAGPAYAQVHIDMSPSLFQVQAPETLRIRNLAVPGYPGRYWVELQWDPVNFVFSAVNYGDDTALSKTLLLTGHWHFIEAMGSSVFTDDYTLTTVSASQNSQGGYFIDGTDQYGDPVVASYFPKDGNWALLDPSDYLFDNFFVFYTDGRTVLPGSCYYLAYHDGRLSNCYPLTGTKTAAAAAALARAQRAPEQALRLGEAEPLERDTAPIDPDVIEKYRALKAYTK